jgi:hypothetical protein
MKHATCPVAITPLMIGTLPCTKTGLTEFTFSRYLVPYLCNYEGYAAFLDADVLVRGDISAIFTPRSEPVSVVKNALKFEWPSVMYFNNAQCRVLTPDYVRDGSPHTLQWCEPGELAKEWNYLVGYEPECGKPENPQIVHFTGGIPCFEQTKNSPYADEWHAQLKSACTTVSWEAIMGNSVHRKAVERLKAA